MLLGILTLSIGFLADFTRMSWGFPALALFMAPVLRENMSFHRPPPAKIL